MRFVFSFILVLALCLPVSASAVEAESLAYGELAGGYYLIASTDDFTSTRISVPAEFAVDCFTLDDSGLIISTANETVYGYSSDYALTDDWTGLIRWISFGSAEAQYRDYDSFGGYKLVWIDINAFLVDSSNNVSVMSSVPLRLSTQQYFGVGLGLMAFLAVVIMIFKRR